jgi:hypothetical protein
MTAATAALCESLPGIRTVSGVLSTREADATTLLIGLCVLAAFAAAAQWLDQQRSTVPAVELSKSLRRLAAAAAVVFALTPTAIILTASSDNGSAPAATGANASRLQSLESNRTRYWKVGLDQFAASPLTGEGSGSFRGTWQRSPNGSSPALNAHSLEIETLAELGLLGLLALAAMAAGTWLAGRNRRTTEPGLLAGASAALALFAAHSAIDWDLQVPGLMYVVTLLAAGVCFLPRPGFDVHEGRWAKALATVIGLAAITWSAHLWEADVLTKEANRMVETARVLGWTPAREEYALSRLDEAAWLNPDPRPKADRTIVLFSLGRKQQAAQEARALAKENQNWWFGWALVWKYRNGKDRQTAVEARDRGLRLRGLEVPTTTRTP